MKTHLPFFSMAREALLTNTLGMPFVPVTGSAVLFCQWETRVQDYAAFASETPGLDRKWSEISWLDYQQSPLEPVINVSWDDAQAFCAWLGQRDERTYRLPTDAEWSLAAALGASPDDPPYPWGAQWPPPVGAGNYAGGELNRFGFPVIAGYWDYHPFTSPVGSYRPNPLGLYDLSGNVWEWCQDGPEASSPDRLLRGACWSSHEASDVALASRKTLPRATRCETAGFRVVLENPEPPAPELFTNSCSA